jgi:hypothetical protein
MINENIDDCVCETLKGRFEYLREDYKNMHECCYQVCEVCSGRYEE